MLQLWNMLDAAFEHINESRSARAENAADYYVRHLIDKYAALDDAELNRQEVLTDLDLVRQRLRSTDEG